VIGAASPRSGGTPAGSHIGREPETRKGFVITPSNRPEIGIRCFSWAWAILLLLIDDNLWPVETILSVLQVAFAVIVIFLVLMHSGKDAGLSGAFGVGSGQGPLGGGSMVERNLNRWTVFFCVLFLINAIVLLKRPWA
jgi:preprotein translocase subunit SecG